MKKISLFITILLFAAATCVQAQKPRPKTNPPKNTKPVTKQMATTDEGKLVELSSDGTWRYVDASSEVATQTPVATKPVSKQNGVLSLEAGLVFNSGDVKPVGRATFYLLKEDASKIVLTQAHLDAYNQDMARFRSSETLDKWSMYGAVLYMDGQLAPTFAVAVKKSLDAAAVSQATTGFDGKASFENVPVGDYYLFGYYRIGKQTTYWSIPVTVKAGTNNVVLDNNNMKG